jgi:hypothetical protein
MAEWTEPKDMKEWMRRGLSLQQLILTAVCCALLATELKFDWVERVIGAYLVTTNAERPESGAIWEKGRKTRTAWSAVEKLAADRESSQRMARNAGSLDEIMAALAPGQGVMLSAEHFREVYQKLPQGFAAEMISPFELLRLISDGQWTRVYLERSADGVMIYLLAPDNQVLRQVRVAAASLALLARGSAAASQALEDLPNFQGRIYPANRFFSALASFPDDVRRDLIPQPERLLESPGQITRVGISDEAVSGFVEIGFEIRTGSQRRVELVQGQDWAVWRLRSVLEGKAPAERIAPAPREGPSPQ